MLDLGGDVVDQHGERREGPLADLVLRDIERHGGARIAEHIGLEGRHRARRQRLVEGVGRRHGADQDQHNEAHALLPVIRAMGKADPGTGQDQQAADPQRRRRPSLGRLVQRRIADQQLRQQKEACRQDEPDQRREQQRFDDVERLAPVDAAGAVLPGQQLIHQPDADDRTDQRVRARIRYAEIPGAKIPDDRGDQQREDHRKAGLAADLQDQLDRQQRDDAEGNQAARG